MVSSEKENVKTMMNRMLKLLACMVKLEPNLAVVVYV